MADFISYRLTGADDLSAKFKALPEHFRSKIATPAAKDAMDIVLADAKLRADRVDDRETANYIADNLAKIERRSLGKELGAVIVSVGIKQARRGQLGGNTFYWWWVELGTEHSRAQPFLRAALHTQREEVFREFLSSAKYQLLKVGGP